MNTYLSRGKAKLVAVGVTLATAATHVSATSYFGADVIGNIVDTVGDFGTLIGAIVDLLPNVQELLIALAIMAMIVGIIVGLTSFITMLLYLPKLMKMVGFKW